MNGGLGDELCGKPAWGADTAISGASCGERGCLHRSISTDRTPGRKSGVRKAGGPWVVGKERLGRRLLHLGKSLTEQEELRPIRQETWFQTVPSQMHQMASGPPWASLRFRVYKMKSEHIVSIAPSNANS